MKGIASSFVICTSNPMAKREIWDEFPEEIYKMQNFPSAAREIEFC